MRAETKAPVLELRDIVKKFGAFTAVNGVSLDIANGEFITLVGPSGSGKTTMIRMLVGMDKPSSGEIRLDGRVINDVPANKRPTCMVFQSLALFPHKSVGENIEFSMKIAGVPRDQRRRRVEELLRQLRLPLEYYERNVSQCSGGERQRIALARALAFNPEILFFDEPLSALDFRLRKTLEKELKDIHRETGKTFVYITHSLEEAMVMSDRIAIMKDGEIVQVGTPGDIYNRPINKFVAQFMGEVNTLEVERVGPDRVRNVSDKTEFAVSDMDEDFRHGYLVVRPEFMRIGEAARELPNTVEGVLFNDYALGSRVQYLVRASSDDYHWVVEKLQDELFREQLDQSVVIGWRPEDSILVKE